VIKVDKGFTELGKLGLAGPLHRQSGGRPFREPVLEPRSPVSPRGQFPHRLVGIDAVGAAAIGDDVAVTAEIGQLGGDLVLEPSRSA
jgi:hypothetical protein